MKKSRGEVLFRLWFSLAGLILLGVVVMVRGIANAPALVEVFGVAGLFFGGTLIWSLRHLFWVDRDPE